MTLQRTIIIAGASQRRYCSYEQLSMTTTTPAYTTVVAVIVVIAIALTAGEAAI
jgi:hypothetical protein